MRPMVVAAFAVATVAGLLAAQSPSPQRPPTFVAGIDVVKLDVSVYDKDHHPIKGLTAADFTVLEDKLERPVVGLAEVDLPEPPPAPAAWMRNAPDDVASNDVVDKRLFLIVVDDVSQDLTDFDTNHSLRFKANRDRLIATAKTFISRLEPTDVTALIFVGDSRRNQDFTTDHGRLIAALEKTLANEPFSQPASPFGESLPVTVLHQAVRALIDVPAPRKAVVDITNGIDCLMGYERTSAERLFADADRARVAIYMMRPADHVAICGGGVSSVLDRAAPDAALLTRAPLETGGLAFMGVDDPAVAAKATQQIFEANGSYYMVGYTSANLAKIHSVKVLVNRPDAEVRTRPMYYPPKPDSEPEGPPPPATLAAIAGVIPKSDILLHAAVAPFASVARPGAAPGGSAAVVIRVRQARPSGRTVPFRETLDLRAAAFTAEGDPRGTSTRAVEVQLPAGAGDLDYEILHRVDGLKPGVYELRLGLHSHARDVEGSVYVTVDVPDFAREPLSLSGMVLTADNGLAVDGSEQLRALLPVTPTTVRTFDRGEPVTAFLRAYEGGGSPTKPVAMRTRIVNERDQAVLDRSETIDQGRFDRSRAASILVRIPTGQLAPGSYLLQVTADLGKTSVRREIRFSMR